MCDVGSLGMRTGDALRVSTLFSNSSGVNQHLLSFPTRRSSDLSAISLIVRSKRVRSSVERGPGIDVGLEADRKSTRLNSSHITSSYAVFCLKKKKIRWRR